MDLAYNTKRRSQPTVQVSGVTKSFGIRPVLQGVDLELHPGRVYGLVGENGSGKSTLIKILSGYHRTDSGAVTVDGAPLRLGSPAASHVAGLRFVHQHLGVVPQMNAVENMGLGLGFANPRWVRWKREAEEARKLLAELRIDMDVEKPLSEARAVERSAVAIARALRPEEGCPIRLLVLDEPTAALPPAEVDALFAVIRRACARGIAVIYVSHRLDEVEQITDEVAVLRDGVLVGRQTTADMRRGTMIGLMLGTDEEPSAWERRPEPPPASSAADKPPVLDVRGLRGRALDGVDFTVGAGEIVGFAGIDGSGREELARALVGAFDVAGEVIVDGKRLDRLSPATAADAGLVLVPSITEPGAAVAAFTVKENLTLASLPSLSSRWGVRRHREHATAREWIDKVDVRPPDPSLLISLLSGGNRQKIVLAKWLALGKPVYVLNEPTAGVDVGARRRIHEFVIAQAERGLTFLVCSSDLEDLEAMCHRVLVLRAGRVQADLRDKDIGRATLLEQMSANGEVLSGTAAAAAIAGG